MQMVMKLKNTMLSIAKNPASDIVETRNEKDFLFCKKEVFSVLYLVFSLFQFSLSFLLS